jgi:molybdopterin converting factor small subunit
MITVKVHLAGPFRLYGHPKDLSLRLSNGSTLNEVLEELEKLGNQGFKKDVSERILKDKGLQQLVFVNQKSLRYSWQWDQPLEDGDHIRFLPPMEGG